MVLSSLRRKESRTLVLFPDQELRGSGQFNRGGRSAPANYLSPVKQDLIELYDAAAFMSRSVVVLVK